MIPINDIKKFTESDVEMKIIYPLLTKDNFDGLKFSDYHIQTKSSLKKILIDKGSSSKLYYPDFAIIVEGLPILIVEAKKPNEDLDEGYRQACLYASEINREFPTDINPCQYVMAIDGLTLLAGKYDSSNQFNIEYSDWNSTNVEFDKFINQFSFKHLSTFATELRAKLGTESKFKNPINLLGGKKIKNLESNNSFGENISIQYEHLFNPKYEFEKEDIVRNAYVKQNKIESHITPIDTLFDKKIAERGIIEVDESKSKYSISNKFESHSELNNKVLLLIGSVGSGKSTFITYLREVALKDEVRKSTTWISLNLNDAPLNKDEIYFWLKSNIIDKIKKLNEEFDFDSLEFIMELYHDEINALKKGVLKLFDPSDIDYKRILAENIQKFQNDIDLTLKNLIKKTISDVGKSIVIVLDNCDKRNTDEQLLMFDVANWVRDNIKSIVFLPLRETTYENHKYEKPLDTVVKDLIFKINPPSLEHVLTSRIEYISRLNDTGKDGHYTMSNGIKVKYPSKDEVKYLSIILHSLFENQFFKSLISGFAGRNIRNGIEIFLDFCKSGHINEAEIIKMINSKGDYNLPNHLISKVFIRGNKVYYTDEKSRIKNVFHSFPGDKIKDPFVRISILQFLFDNRYTTLVNKFEGYYKTVDLVKFFNLRGHDEKRIIEELKFLLRQSLIENETLNSDVFDINDLVKITSTGIANLKIHRNIEYLAAIAEDMWYRDNLLADEIVENMSGNGEFAHLSIQCVSIHARKLINYLEQYYNQNFLPLSHSISENGFKPIDFKLLNSDIDDFDKNIRTDTVPNLVKGKIYEGSIVNIQDYGMICEIVGTSFFGLLHSSELQSDFIDKYKMGGKVDVQIKVFNKNHNKYNLKLA